MVDYDRERPGEAWGGAGEEALAPVRERVRAHPWLGIAAGIAAGALLGALSRREEDDAVRVRVERNQRVRILLRPGEPPEPEAEDEAPGITERARTRLGGMARGAGGSLRRAWEDAEDVVRDAELGSALRSGVERIAEHVPGRRPRSRAERLRRAVSDALPRRKRTLGERVQRAFR